MSPFKIILIAGAIAFVGNIKNGKDSPDGLVKIALATFALGVVLNLANGTKLQTPVKWLAALTLLSSLLYYTGDIVKTPTATKKGKTNG